MSEPLKHYGPLTNGTAFMGMRTALPYREWGPSDGDYYLASDVDAARASDKALIAKLQATLDGDPDQSATPDERRAWRASAVRYADKCEALIARLVDLVKRYRGCTQDAPWLLTSDADAILDSVKEA